MEEKSSPIGKRFATNISSGYRAYLLYSFVLQSIIFSVGNTLIWNKTKIPRIRENLRDFCYRRDKMKWNKQKEYISIHIRINRKERMVCLPLLNPEDPGRAAGHEFCFKSICFLTVMIVYRILHGDGWRKNEYILNSSRKNCIKNMNSADIKIPQPLKNSCGIFIKMKGMKKMKKR